MTGYYNTTYTAYGSYTTGSWTAHSNGGYYAYITFTDTTADVTCTTTYNIESGCFLNAGYSCNSGPVVYIDWWWWGLPLIIVIVISSAVTASVRYRRVRALRLAAAGFYATNTATTTTTYAAPQQTTVVGTAVPTATVVVS